MQTQTEIDFTERYTLSQCEYLQEMLKIYSSNCRVVKDERGYFITLFYSDKFLTDRLKLEIIK